MSGRNNVYHENRPGALPKQKFRNLFKMPPRKQTLPTQRELGHIHTMTSTQSNEITQTGVKLLVTTNYYYDVLYKHALELLYSGKHSESLTGIEPVTF